MKNQANSGPVDFRDLVELSTLDPRLESLSARTLFYGLDDHKKAILLSMLVQKLEQSTLFVFENEKKAKSAIETFQDIGLEQVYFFPAEESIPFAVLAKSHDTENQRAEILSRLAAGEKIMVVASIAALRKKIMPREIYAGLLYTIENGSTLDVPFMTEFLVEAGYERSEIVIKRGQFSIRGGIVDLFPVLYEDPIRIELFDDEVDSIRSFDLETQKSKAKMERVTVSPAKELICHKPQKEVLSKLEADSAKQLEGYIDNKEARQNFLRLLAETKEKISENIGSNEISYLYSYHFDEDALLFDYFSEDSTIFIDEPKRIAAVAELAEKEEQKIYKDLLKRGKVFKAQQDSYANAEDLTKAFSQRHSIFLSLLPTQGAFDIPYSDRISCDFFGDVISFFSKVDHFFETAKEKVKKGYRVFTTIEKEQNRKQLKEESAYYDIEFKELELDQENMDPQEISPGLYFADLNLDRGFEDKKGKNLFITELDIYNRKKKKVRQIYNKDAERIGSVTDLAIGDFVVHSGHGIGQYFGINTLDVEGIKNDYLVIKYRGDDKLFVPVEQVHNLQKFIGSEEKRPKLNKLGGSEWQRTKAKVQQSIEDMSEELLELYAARRMSQGVAFSADDFMQKDFEDAFPFEETNDQLRSIADIKMDMERSIPMDRLLCGDVGYGKTEVAMRAAFKAVRDSKQVAILVPTTILAEQHHQSFSKRFADFPVTIEVLSRFRSAKEEARIKEDLKTGKVDIVIGTHKLLAKTMAFKDLGLLVIDEEQRFGVKHKEKIKQMKEEVDVLTLSATPIPRTLQMSLAGLRDMSVIETPPKNRYPIQTFVVEKNDDLLREVMMRELGRNGQIYYVHNRVNDIYLEAGKVMETVPEARVAIAHGQMRESDLEKTMIDFMEHEKDCLVCTTIIETGLDIPNVNTLIVDEADKYGLSQLYQLRGRVGRSERVAYAYLTYKSDKMLSENAEKRLKAIKDFTELGSGFKIALRDLEIRGAGNLLGKEQHGHLDAIGFALYTQMLQETIERVKAREENRPEAPKAGDFEISLPISALIPEDYISAHGLKLEFYQKIKNAPSEESILEIEEELIDRFGDFPEEVGNLLAIGRIRVIMTKNRIRNLKLKNNVLMVTIAEESQIDPEKIVELSEKYKDRLRFKEDGGFIMQYGIKYKNKDDLLAKIQEFIDF